MIYTIGSVIIISILSYIFYKPIHKYKYLLYLAAFVLALVLHEDGNYITYGFTGLSFFIVVVYLGLSFN